MYAAVNKDEKSDKHFFVESRNRLGQKEACQYALADMTA
jgi:hypothetical protein